MAGFRDGELQTGRHAGMAAATRAARHSSKRLALPRQEDLFVPKEAQKPLDLSKELSPAVHLTGALKGHHSSAQGNALGHGPLRMAG